MPIPNDVKSVHCLFWQGEQYVCTPPKDERVYSGQNVHPSEPIFSIDFFSINHFEKHDFKFF